MKWWVLILLPFHLLAQETYDNCVTIPPQTYQVEHDANKVYYWSISNGHVVSTLDNTITVQWPDSVGEYVISVHTMRFGCEGDTSHYQVVIEACSYLQIFVPNSFTPNEDNHNETFYVHGVGGIEIESTVIYNRWGEKVYETTSNEPWDGENCQIGIYTYSIRTHNQHYTGQVSLIR